MIQDTGLTRMFQLAVLKSKADVCYSNSRIALMISRRTLVTLVVRGFIVRNDSKYKSLTKRDILNKLQDYF